jgi:ABC-type glycerol-3-phosphate transport system permease component
MARLAAVATPARRTSTPPAGRIVGRLIRFAFLGFWAVLCLAPLVLVISTAQRDPTANTGNPFDLFASIRPQNFIDAWTLGNFGHYFVNTVVIVIPTVVGVLILSTMSGYAFARFEFPGRNALFYLFILGLMVPFFAVMIPLFYNLRDYGLLDTPWAVILPLVAGAGGTGLPLGVFLMRAFFLDLPNELGDAARVDGAGEWAVFRFVMVPLALPGSAALAILTFLSAWNNFLLPLIYTPSEDHRTLATGLLIFTGGRTQSLELAAAASLIMVAPVVVFFLLFQRQFVNGLTAGAVKG